MARSIAEGDYRMVGTVRSASDQNAWYPISLDVNYPQHDARPGEQNPPWRLSCNCPAWTRDVRGQHPRRSCKHTDPFNALLNKQAPTGARSTIPAVRNDQLGTILGHNPALAHITGKWTLQEFDAPIVGMRQGMDDPERYHWFLMNVLTADLTTATGIVAVPAGEVPRDPRILEQTIAAWAGYQIAADFMIRAGERPGVPPAYYKDEGRKKKRAQDIAGAIQAPRAPRQDGAPKYGIGDLMVAMHDADQGDGLRPEQRAEDLLRMMLGGRYADVDPNRAPYKGYLDAPSKTPQKTLSYLWELNPDAMRRFNVTRTCNELVFRVRIDKGRKYDRRVRVWVDGVYRCDLCIVRDGYIGSKVPVADGFLSRYLGFLANEMAILKVIGGYNIFGKFSDEGAYGHDPEGAPPARMRVA